MKKHLRGLLGAFITAATVAMIVFGIEIFVTCLALIAHGELLRFNGKILTVVFAATLIVATAINIWSRRYCRCDLVVRLTPFGVLDILYKEFRNISLFFRS